MSAAARDFAWIRWRYKNRPEEWHYKEVVAAHLTLDEDVFFATYFSEYPPSSARSLEWEHVRQPSREALIHRIEALKLEMKTALDKHARWTAMLATLPEPDVASEQPQEGADAPMDARPQDGTHDHQKPSSAN